MINLLYVYCAVCYLLNMFLIGANYKDNGKIDVYEVILWLFSPISVLFIVYVAIKEWKKDGNYGNL